MPEALFWNRVRSVETNTSPPLVRGLRMAVSKRYWSEALTPTPTGMRFPPCRIAVTGVG